MEEKYSADTSPQSTLYPVSTVSAQIQSKYVKMELANLKLSCHEPSGSLCCPQQTTIISKVKGRLIFSRALDTAVEFVLDGGSAMS